MDQYQEVYKESNDLISIIVPVYNVEEYLHRCIDSILCQTYRNLEIILVDDGSSDRCPEICDELIKLDSRIVVIHKENCGLGYARNSGLEICSGKFIMFVDSDDYLSTDAVQILHERIVLDNSDLAIGKHVDLYEDGTTNGAFCNFMKDCIIDKEDVFLSVPKQNRYAVVAWGKMYRTELLGNIKYPALKCSEDLWVFYDIINRCNKISIVDKVIYYYFQRHNSILHSKSEQAELDDLNANMHTVKFFVKYNYWLSAKKYYEIGISKALLITKKNKSIEIINEYLTCSEKKRLLQGQSLKNKVKLLALYVPIIHKMIQYIKRLINKRGI